jgi:hypothetical protein
VISGLVPFNYHEIGYDLSQRLSLSDPTVLVEEHMVVVNSSFCQFVWCSNMSLISLGSTSLVDEVSVMVANNSIIVVLELAVTSERSESSAIL